MIDKKDNIFTRCLSSIIHTISAEIKTDYTNAETFYKKMGTTAQEMSVPSAPKYNAATERLRLLALKIEPNKLEFALAVVLIRKKFSEPGYRANVFKQQKFTAKQIKDLNTAFAKKQFSDNLCGAISQHVKMYVDEHIPSIKFEVYRVTYSIDSRGNISGNTNKPGARYIAHTYLVHKKTGTVFDMSADQENYKIPYHMGKIYYH
ncbi:MAG: hypothetical protein FWE50_00245 [Alphaproteobacteria bacterium]|nr:hypothetical protein [Alphaproteobacteria bacterium]